MMILKATDLVVVLVLAMSVGTKAVSDTHGRMFLVSTPALGNCTIQFFVCTWSSAEVKVIFTTSTSQKLIMVSRSTPIATIWKEQIKNIPKASLRPVHRFMGDHEFSLSVMLTFQKYNMTYQQETVAIPIAGWGRKYFITTLWSEPFLVVTSAVENTVKIFIRTSGLTRLQVEYKGANYTDGDVMTINLHMNQGFTFQFCSNNGDHRNLLGTTVDGNYPFGLTSGNCAGFSTEQPCNYSATSNKLAATGKSSNVSGLASTSTAKNSGLILDMLLPIESFGTQFVTLPVIPLRQPVYVWVMNGEEVTQFDVVGCDSKRRTYKMLAGKSRTQLDVQNCSHLIQSNKPVQVICVFASTCNLTVNTTPDVTILLPVSLFMNYYIWMTPTIGDASIQHYVMFILWLYRYTMELDGDSLTAMDAHYDQAVGAAYVVGYLEVSSGPHWMVNLLPSNFGLYVAGFGHLLTYARPVGFISSEIALKCWRSNGTIRAGDFIDNDCDGKVDEESKDGNDNDFDDLVDEDLFQPLLTGVVNSTVRTTSEITPKMSTKTSIQPQENSRTAIITAATSEKTAVLTEMIPIPVHGEWSDWSEWKCSENCSEKRMIQLRQCDNPPPGPGGKTCDGFPFRYKYGGCKRVCPEDCPFGTWGLNCSGSCINCVQECDKFTGRCGNCKEGFQYPLQSCNKACGYNSYGADCQGNCLEKCDGQDCLERTIGVCPEISNPLHWLWMMLPILLIPTMILFILRYRNTKPVEDKVIIDKMAQIMSKSEVMLFALAEIEQDRRSTHSRRSSRKLHHHKSKKSKSNIERPEQRDSEVD